MESCLKQPKLTQTRMDNVCIFKVLFLSNLESGAKHLIGPGQMGAKISLFLRHAAFQTSVLTCQASDMTPRKILAFLISGFLCR